MTIYGRKSKTLEGKKLVADLTSYLAMPHRGGTVFQENIGPKAHTRPQVDLCYTINR